jgi:small subunit ribosomal protein S6e
MSQKPNVPRLVLSDPSTGTAKTIQLTPQQLAVFRGKKIGDVIDGGPLGLGDFKIKITGGSDFAGFPMRPDVSGTRLARVLLTKGIGFKARRKPPSKAKKRRNRRTVKGLRKRVSVRGNTISDAIVQINAVIVR